MAYDICKFKLENWKIEIKLLKLENEIEIEVCKWKYTWIES